MPRFKVIQHFKCRTLNLIDAIDEQEAIEKAAEIDIDDADNIEYIYTDANAKEVLPQWSKDF